MLRNSDEDVASRLYCSMKPTQSSEVVIDMFEHIERANGSEFLLVGHLTRIN